MADYYLEYSEVIDGLTDEQLDWWEAEEKRIASGSFSEDEECDLCTDFAVDRERRQIWFQPDESGNAEAVALVVHRYLKECDPEGCFYLKWAESCSTPQVGAFGGGAVFVTAEKIEWAQTDEWLRGRVAEFKKAIMDALKVPKNVQESIQSDHEPSMIDMAIEKERTNSQRLLCMVGKQIRSDLQQLLTKDELELFLMRNPWIKK